jgi:polyhydroxyalkanoate synthesis repressor PhaR
MSEFPVLIKKYPNRRLYNMQTSCYITLADIFDMVKRQEHFIVKDAKTSKDLTHSILLQVLVDQEERGNRLLQEPLLRAVITLYAKSQRGSVSAYLQHALTQFEESNEIEETKDTRI